ncbi:MAG TPA: hypothetical protein VK867_00595 [Candidatus Limnocylindrales bacterium]|nr:hypothetical protein [Candidatus Limnocylindrales bacterium]
MALTKFRGRECGDLLPFEEVRRRLGLMTRLPAGRREVAVDDIIGSVGRVVDFDGCFRPRSAVLRRAIAERAANPNLIDLPISLIQVDHAYFVEDGHKRLSMAIAAGRRFIEADVDRFQTDLHLAPGTTMASVRATAQERRFRRVTGLDRAVPRCRFALSDADGYLELQESVKAHTLDYSRSIGRLVSPEEGARHWYDTVFVPIREILAANDALRLLETMTDADRFLLFRRGLDGPMDRDWRIPEWAVQTGLANVRGRNRPRGVRSRLPTLARRAGDRPAELLPLEPGDA